MVEDFEPFRKYIWTLLQQRLGLLVVGEVSDGPAAVLSAQELRPDLVLLDMSLPTMSGMEVARQLRKVALQAKIIFLTQDASPDIVTEAFNLGARGYLRKLDVQKDLLPAIEAVIAGKRFVSTSASRPDIPFAE